jgi:hypothetical protein
MLDRHSEFALVLAADTGVPASLDATERIHKLTDKLRIFVVNEINLIFSEVALHGSLLVC